MVTAIKRSNNFLQISVVFGRDVSRSFSRSCPVFGRKATHFYSDPNFNKTDFHPIPSATENPFGEPYRKLNIFPVQQTIIEKSKFVPSQLRILPPRSTKMNPTQDWTNVWPTAHSFKASVVPLPIRMGFLKNKQLLHRQPPKKHANLELMKIPNFLHLTPKAIEKHCQAIKKFCTVFPKEVKDEQTIDKYLPIDVSTSDYVFSGQSVRDVRSRIVTLKIKLSNLSLDSHSRWKLITLAGSRYDNNTDTLTIVTDRCPARHQNYDYAIYLLSVLYHQSRKVEAWECEIEEDDRLQYSWHDTKSKKAVYSFLRSIFIGNKECLAVRRHRYHIPRYLSQFVEQSEITDDDLDKVDELKKHAKILAHYFNNVETDESVRRMAVSVRHVFSLPKLQRLKTNIEQDNVEVQEPVSE